MLMFVAQMLFGLLAITVMVVIFMMSILMVWWLCERIINRLWYSNPKHDTIGDQDDRA